MPCVNVTNLRTRRANIKKQRLLKSNAKKTKNKKSNTEEVKSPAPKAKDLHALTQTSAVATKRLLGQAQHLRQKAEKTEANYTPKSPVEDNKQQDAKDEIKQSSPIRRMQFGVPLPTSDDRRHAKQLRRQQKHDAKQAKKLAERQLKEQQLAERLAVKQARQTAQLVAKQAKQAAKVAKQQAKEAAQKARSQARQAEKMARIQAKQAKKLAKAQAKQAKKAKKAERAKQQAPTEASSSKTQSIVFDQPILLCDGDMIRVRPMETRHKVEYPIARPQPVQETEQTTKSDLQATTTSYYDATATAKAISSSEVKPARKQRKRKSRKQLTSRAAAQALATKPEENVLYVPALSRRPSRAELINAESRIGSQIFGPVPAGHRREFFHDQRGVWIWHEDWTDNRRQEHNLTVRYEVRPSGIYKKVAAGKYFKLEGNELENFRHATHAYLKLIKSCLYQTVAVQAN